MLSSSANMSETVANMIRVNRIPDLYNSRDVYGLCFPPQAQHDAQLELTLTALQEDKASTVSIPDWISDGCGSCKYVKKSSANKKIIPNCTNSTWGIVKASSLVL